VPEYNLFIEGQKVFSFNQTTYRDAQLLAQDIANCLTEAMWSRYFQPFELGKTVTFSDSIRVNREGIAGAN
jgi:hypothetical protein